MAGNSSVAAVPLDERIPQRSVYDVLVGPSRINVFERWESQANLDAFRGSGPSEEQGAAMLAASVAGYDVANVRSLT